MQWHRRQVECAHREEELSTLIVAQQEEELIILAAAHQAALNPAKCNIKTNCRSAREKHEQQCMNRLFR